MVSSSMPSANAVARAWNAAGRELMVVCRRWLTGDPAMIPTPKGVHLIRAGQRIDLDLIYVGEEDGQHVFEAVGVPPLPTDRFCVDTLPPKTTVRYCLDLKLIPVPKELPDA